MLWLVSLGSYAKTVVSEIAVRKSEKNPQVSHMSLTLNDDD